MNKYIIILILSLYGFAIYGQTTHIKKLTLQSAIKLANDSSIEAFRSENLYLSKFSEYKNFKARRLPSLLLRMTPIQYNRDIVQRYISNNDRLEYRTQRSLYSFGNISITQNLDWTGGVLFVDTELSFFRNIGYSEATNQFSSVPIRIGYSQSLIGYNPFKWEKQIEPVKFEQARKVFIHNIASTSVAVVDYFFSIALADCDCRLAAKNLESCQQLFNDGIERHKNNTLSSTALLAIELALIDAKNARISCENIRQKTLNRLVTFLNAPKTDSLEIVLPNMPPVSYIDSEQALNYARINHPVYSEQKRNILEAQQVVDKNKKERFVDADINLSFGFNQIANELRAVYHKPLQQNVVSLGITVPLLDWGIRRENLKMAQYNLKVIESSAKQEILAVEEELLAVINDFNTQIQILHASQRAIDLANQVYDESLERFRVGRDDINTLLDNMLKVREAQTKQVQSLYICWKSYYRIQQMTGFNFHTGSSLDINNYL